MQQSIELLSQRIESIDNQFKLTHHQNPQKSISDDPISDFQQQDDDRPTNNDDTFLSSESSTNTSRSEDTDFDHLHFEAFRESVDSILHEHSKMLYSLEYTLSRVEKRVNTFQTAQPNRTRPILSQSFQRHAASKSSTLQATTDTCQQDESLLQSSSGMRFFETLQKHDTLEKERMQTISDGFTSAIWPDRIIRLERENNELKIELQNLKSSIPHLISQEVDKRLCSIESNRQNSSTIVRQSRRHQQSLNKQTKSAPMVSQGDTNVETTLDMTIKHQTESAPTLSEVTSLIDQRIQQLEFTRANSDTVILSMMQQLLSTMSRPQESHHSRLPSISSPVDISSQPPSNDQQYSKFFQNHPLTEAPSVVSSAYLLGHLDRFQDNDFSLIREIIEASSPIIGLVLGENDITIPKIEAAIEQQKAKIVEYVDERLLDVLKSMGSDAPVLSDVDVEVIENELSGLFKTQAHVNQLISQKGANDDMSIKTTRTSSEKDEDAESKSIDTDNPSGSDDQQDVETRSHQTSLSTAALPEQQTLADQQSPPLVYDRQDSIERMLADLDEQLEEIRQGDNWDEIGGEDWVSDKASSTKMAEVEKHDTNLPSVPLTERPSETASIPQQTERSQATIRGPNEMQDERKRRTVLLCLLLSHKFRELGDEVGMEVLKSVLKAVELKDGVKSGSDMSESGLGHVTENRTDSSGNLPHKMSSMQSRDSISTSITFPSELNWTDNNGTDPANPKYWQTALQRLHEEKRQPRQIKEITHEFMEEEEVEESDDEEHSTQLDNGSKSDEIAFPHRILPNQPSSHTIDFPPSSSDTNKHAHSLNDNIIMKTQSHDWNLPIPSHTPVIPPSPVRHQTALDSTLNGWRDFSADHGDDEWVEDLGEETGATGAPITRPRSLSHSDARRPKQTEILLHAETDEIGKLQIEKVTNPPISVQLLSPHPESPNSQASKVTTIQKSRRALQTKESARRADPDGEEGETHGEAFQSSRRQSLGMGLSMSTPDVNMLHLDTMVEPALSERISSLTKGRYLDGVGAGEGKKEGDGEETNVYWVVDEMEPDDLDSEVESVQITQSGEEEDEEEEEGSEEGSDVEEDEEKEH